MTADDRVPYQPLVEALYTGSTNHTFKYRVMNNGGHPILGYRLTYLCKNEVSSFRSFYISVPRVGFLFGSSGFTIIDEVS